ncbi:MAG: hypothetical protein APF81_27415 [Desulfosporosinus sp. BRH_c37]|nr:MAG: hypothetical protein APF81_27415 [Desulfosporosinus sp. BRH_c37]
MLKGILRPILKLLFNRKNKAEARKIERENQRIIRQLERYHSAWKLIMKGQVVSNFNTEKSDHRTLAVVCDRGVVVDHMDGRMIGQRHVVPLYIDSTNWGGMK